jgi:ABC-type lipoprotein export system ATPase subunit
MNPPEILILRMLRICIAFFLQLKETFQQTFIIVTHNPELASLADRVLVMKDGYLTNQSQKPGSEKL